jgi:hypothetical protein
MAVILFGMGEDREGVERAIVTAGFAPALARDAAEWAWSSLRASGEDALEALDAA